MAQEQRITKPDEQVEVDFRTKRKFVKLDEVKSGLAKISGMSELIEEERANLHAADLIREARTAADLSQAALAAKIDVTQARISQMESGEAPYGPSVVLLERIARACGGDLLLSFEKKKAG
jgi:ribosome-binding protein aMBF1 (putative translation factor)